MESFTKLKGVELQSVPYQIANIIKNNIYDKVLSPGDYLPKQDELAKLFAVSRPTIREALDILVESQLIERVNPSSKSYVISNFHPDKALKSVQDIILLSLRFHSLSEWDLFETRRIFEIHSAELAAARRTEEDILELEKLIPPKSILEESTAKILEADTKFHIKIAECTRNPLIKTLIESLIFTYFKLDIQLSRGEKKNIITGLPELFLAIKKGDPVEAKEKMGLHLEFFKEYHT